MKYSKYIIIVSAFSVALLSFIGCGGKKKTTSSSGPTDPTVGQPAPELPTGGVKWINSKPLSLKKLRGKVVLIDFWEYTCINCIRSFPFEKKLYKRYHNDGFEILGIHDPEFDVAYKTPNVRKAVKRFNLPWPVAADPWFSIWKAYNSHTWPNYFLIGPKGKLLGHYPGEGHDAQIEKTIQKQLSKIDKNFDPSKYPIKKQNWFSPSCGDMTEETYVGKWYGRGKLQGQGGYQSGVRHFKAGKVPDDGHFVLTGKWKTAKNGAIFQGTSHSSAPSSLDPVGNNAYPHITLKYHAREIYSVINISHAKNDQGVKVYVSQDGHYLTKKNADADTQFDPQGRSYIMVKNPRMYYLVLNQKGDDGTHVITLWPSKPGLTVNSFTFGNNCTIHFAHLYSHHGGVKRINSQ
ncbi:MAG TPA: redoxin family protein [Balneolaceae bacterium]|nr:redoxin family protein [Balneolaceae bacterium]